MSRHHYSHASEAENIYFDIEHLTNDELKNFYGIEINDETGQVYDPVEKKMFSNLAKWAAFELQGEKWAEGEHAHQTSRRFENDRF